MTNLNRALITVNAAGAAAYALIGAAVIGSDTCAMPGADGGSQMIAGLFFMPVLMVVLVISASCLCSAIYTYATSQKWPLSRYALFAPLCWIVAAAVMRCPQ